MTHDESGPAFPSTRYANDDVPIHIPGMTLRDWFAGRALTGLLTCDPDRIFSNAHAVDEAYCIASIMLERRVQP